MKEAIERIDSGTMFLVIGEAEQGNRQVRSNRTLFENELKVQEANITEPGEKEATSNLRALWQAYQAKLDEQGKITDFQAAKRFYLDDMQKAFEAVKDAADRILALNQDAMLSKSDEAERLARWTNRALLASSAAALAIGVLLSVGLTNRLLRPLSVLTQAVVRVGKGDFEARAKVSGHDEIAHLAEQFNTMTEHLGDYRNSSLGELLLAQRASQAAIDSIPDPVIVFAGDGGVLILNNAAETLLQNGHTEPTELLVGATPGLRTALDHARSHVLQGKGPYLPKGFEDSFAVTTPGGDRWFLLRATPVYEDQGHIAGATVILQDVTKLRRFDELKNDLVATVAHEFRTPLTSLRMAIHLCLEGLAGPLSEKQTDLLYTAREDCSRLQRTVDELLDLARIQSGKIMLSLRPVPAGELVKTALNAYHSRAAEQQVAISADVESDHESVLADPDRIQLVFSNLLANALRHTPAGGTVQVKIVPQPGRVRFEVTDSGEGIPPEYQAAVFEKFFRVPGTTSGAAGLGLSLSKEIVEAHHGKIGLRSKPGSGSTFWFTLPSVARQG